MSSFQYILYKTTTMLVNVLYKKLDESSQLNGIATLRYRAGAKYLEVHYEKSILVNSGETGYINRLIIAPLIDSQDILPSLDDNYNLTVITVVDNDYGIEISNQTDNLSLTPEQLIQEILFLVNGEEA